MRWLLALIPAALMLIVAVLHSHALQAPSSEPLSIGYYVVYWFVFMVPFIVSNAMRKSGLNVNVLSIFAAHKYTPKALATVAYLLLAVCLLLAFSALTADFDPRRRSTAFWLCLLSCPSIVWLHFKKTYEERPSTGK
jgi:hypothetical protein